MEAMGAELDRRRRAARRECSARARRGHGG
uniref:Uncharacterized protein n=1 Tax=Arundo donax TaxID=35708 RepID=A0A0A9H8T5_ARUDO